MKLQYSLFLPFVLFYSVITMEMDLDFKQHNKPTVLSDGTILGENIQDLKELLKIVEAQIKALQLDLDFIPNNEKNEQNERYNSTVTNLNEKAKDAKQLSHQIYMYKNKNITLYNDFDTYTYSPKPTSKRSKQYNSFKSLKKLIGSLRKKDSSELIPSSPEVEPYSFSTPSSPHMNSVPSTPSSPLAYSSIQTKKRRHKTVFEVFNKDQLK